MIYLKKKYILLLLLCIFIIGLLSFSKIYIDNLKTDIKNVEKQHIIEKLKLLSLWEGNTLNNDKFFETRVTFEENLKINDQDFIFKKILLPVPNYYSWGQKAVGYIEEYLDNYLYVSGDGNIYIFKKNDLLLNNLSLNKLAADYSIKLFKIKSNLPQFTSRLIKTKNKNSVKDILVSQNAIYISHVNEKSKRCYNVEIIKGNLNLEKIEFSNFFSYDECLTDINTHALGGNLSDYKNNEILFTIGDGLFKGKAQDTKSKFGKIISINKDTKKYEVFSLGHRNPQGLFYDQENNLILSTEHGPMGGDEINIIKNNGKINNYGWPIASYGEHYPYAIKTQKNKGTYEQFIKDFPLKKNHEEFGFIEPLKYFTPSIGISEIVKIPEINETALKEFYLVGSMGRWGYDGQKSIYYFKIENNRISKLNHTILGERIRDLLFSKDQNLIITILENTPSIGIILLER
tara:strand:- start:84 stop:1463 length:1380 start_codon:yes stop_codon:yes gene_type:complete